MKIVRPLKLITGWVSGVGACALLAVHFISPGYAMDWQLNQSVGASVTFSDNVNLDPDNQKEAGVTPTATYTITGTGQGGRTLFATDTSITARGKSASSKADVDQRITALGRVELVRDRFFVDGLLTSFQELVDAGSALSANPNSGRNSTRSVTTLGISPVYQERLGNWADTQLSYEHIRVLAEGDNDDSTMNGVRFGAVAGSRFSKWKPTFSTGWFDYRETLARPTNSKDDVELTFVELDNQFQVSQNYALLALVGYNDVDAPSSSRELSGVYWSVGIRATPGPRTTIDLRVGERFGEFGLNGLITYLLTPNIALRANASHDVGTSLVRSGGGFQRLSVSTLQGGLGGANGLPTGFLRNNNLDDGLSTRQSVGLGIVGTYGRNTITYGTNFDNQSYDDGDDITWTNRIAWTRQMSRLLSADFSLAYRFVDQRRRAETQAVGGTFALNYLLGSNTTVFAAISRTDRFSPAPGLEFSENSATIGGRLNF